MSLRLVCVSWYPLLVDAGLWLLALDVLTGMLGFGSTANFGLAFNPTKTNPNKCRGWIHPNDACSWVPPSLWWWCLDSRFVLGDDISDDRSEIEREIKTLLPQPYADHKGISQSKKKKKGREREGEAYDKESPYASVACCCDTDDDSICMLIVFVSVCVRGESLDFFPSHATMRFLTILLLLLIAITACAANSSLPTVAAGKFVNSEIYRQIDLKTHIEEVTLTIKAKNTAVRPTNTTTNTRLTATILIRWIMLTPVFISFSFSPL